MNAWLCSQWNRRKIGVVPMLLVAIACGGPEGQQLSSYTSSSLRLRFAYNEAQWQVADATDAAVVVRPTEAAPSDSWPLSVSMHVEEGTLGGLPPDLFRDRPDGLINVNRTDAQVAGRPAIKVESMYSTAEPPADYGGLFCRACREVDYYVEWSPASVLFITIGPSSLERWKEIGPAAEAMVGSVERT